MTRQTGYRRDPLDHRRTPFERMASRLGLGAEPRGSADVRRADQPMLDQVQTSGCVGHAGAIAFYVGLEGLILPSPHELYRNTRAIDRYEVSIPLEDDGAEPNQLFRAVEEFGLRPLDQPWAGGDANPLTVNDEPKLGDLEAASVFRAFGAYEIFTSGSRRSTQVALALDAGKAVCAAIAGGSEDFQRYDGGVLSAIGEALDHYIVIVAYRNLPDGRRVFTLQNSWGSFWGIKGYAEIDESCLAELGDVVVVDVKGIAQ